MEPSHLFKALADPNRLRAMMALKDRALCVCQLVELLALAPSTVSKHLALLAAAQLVTREKRARWVYYQWPQEPGTDVSALLSVLPTIAEQTTQFHSDQQRLRTILQQDPDELCLQQAGQRRAKKETV